MDTKKLLISIAIILGIVLIVSGTYFFYTRSRQVNLDSQTQQTSETKDNLSFGSQLPVNFSFDGMSDEYSDLMKELTIFLGNRISSENTKDDYISIYNKALDVFYDTNVDSKERAYAANVFTLIFGTSFDSTLFLEAIKNRPELLAVFNSKFKEASAYKSLKSGGVVSVMTSLGTPQSNFATQKTISFLEGKAYNLYPNSYSFLRENLNNVQADLILFENVDLGKTYKNYSEFVKDRYSKEYISSFESKLDKFKKENTLYKDTYTSSHEIDIMIASGYLWSLKYVPIKYDVSAASLGNKRLILTEMNSYADHMVAIQNAYGASYKSFFPKVIAALNKIQIVQEKVLEKAESDRIEKEAYSLMEDIISRGNTSLVAWIANLDRKGSLNQRLEYMMQNNIKIREYVNTARASTR